MKRFAVILGASGGIGEAISRKLAADGWSLYLHFNKNNGRVSLLQKELSALYPNGEFHIVQSDFSKQEGAEILAAQVGHVQAVIVASGQSMLKLLTDTTGQDMDALWRVHLQNPALFISYISSQLRSHPVSYIVFIGSIWGNTGAANEVMYSAVKGAQHAFVKAYAKEAAYTGTRVNAIAPGWIETQMNNELSDEDRQMVIHQIPLQKTGLPEEVADFASFLISGKADYMTGEIVNLNGGWYI
ncbi:elongation factor P 5-aminopentanone reductase [Sporosarcina highlanderae]|uniref:SDR family oxidoreductase n=1 Tax=Sporosarcina highlanderae TaxID=3035916 RepID=A0ABT8JQG5_9BACL|nr:SDR family oxidoreductase [Sporosarcina highlanderae]MDN4607401.1 SDR family oxidoreductase [Sporosarcina highlanderae]